MIADVTDSFDAVKSEMSEKRIEKPLRPRFKVVWFLNVFLGHVGRAMNSEDFIGGGKNLNILKIEMIVVVTRTMS